MVIQTFGCHVVTLVVDSTASPAAAHPAFAAALPARCLEAELTERPAADVVITRPAASLAAAAAKRHGASVGFTRPAERLVTASTKRRAPSLGVARRAPCLPATPAERYAAAARALLTSGLKAAVAEGHVAAVAAQRAAASFTVRSAVAVLTPRLCAIVAEGYGRRPSVLPALVARAAAALVARNEPAAKRARWIGTSRARCRKVRSRRDTRETRACTAPVAAEPEVRRGGCRGWSLCFAARTRLARDVAAYFARVPRLADAAPAVDGVVHT